MFNGAFNQMPFNRPFSVDIYGSFILQGNGDLSLLANAIMQPSFELEGTGELLLNAIREQFFSFVLVGIGELETKAIRERYGSFRLQGIGELRFSAARYHVDEIEFRGEFKQGDRIIIDTNNLKMTLNGQNALHLMEGDFFDFNTGPNELTYSDDQTGRTVLIRLTHRDKFV